MSSNKIPGPLGHVRTRFEFNIKRVRGLVTAFGADKDENRDILRAAVVLLHATLEDALRGMLLWKLPDAPAEVLKGVVFNGLFPGTTDRLEKISFAQLLQHRTKSVEDVCRAALKAHLNHESFNDRQDVARALLRLGIPVKDYGKLLDQIEPAILRRHQIVHQCDRAPAEEDYGKRQPIASEEVEGWIGVISQFIEKALTCFEEDRIKRHEDAIKSISRKRFDNYGPQRQGLAEILTVEKAWFSDERADVLGTVLFDRTDKDYGWVMLARDPEGSFRAIDTGTSLESLEEASKQLITRMAFASASGQKVFEQD